MTSARLPARPARPGAGPRAAGCGRAPASERIEKDGGTSYTFVTDAIEAAVKQARAVANGKDVLLAGGASIARQALPAGLVDEVVLHIVPKLVGRSVRLFDSAQVDMRCVETVQGEGAVHLRYEVR